MKKVLRNALTITNNSIILAIPLILFVKLADLYSLYSKYHIDTTLKLLIAFITLVCMFSVFAAGWFNMVKDAIQLSKQVFVLDKDRTKAVLNLFKSLLDGVGKYFLSFLGASLIYIFVIQLIAAQVVFFIGGRFIGALSDESMKLLQEISLSAAASDSLGMPALIDKMTPEMIIYFGKWSLLFVIITVIVSYLLMLWIPEMMYKEPNPIKALGKSIVKLFKKFFKTAGLFIFLWIIGFILLFICSFSIIINPVVYILMNVLMFYFFVYLTVSIFLYYDCEYEK